MSYINQRKEILVLLTILGSWKLRGMSWPLQMKIVYVEGVSYHWKL